MYVQQNVHEKVTIHTFNTALKKYILKFQSSLYQKRLPQKM